MCRQLGDDWVFLCKSVSSVSACNTGSTSLDDHRVERGGQRGSGFWRRMRIFELLQPTLQTCDTGTMRHKSRVSLTVAPFARSILIVNMVSGAVNGRFAASASMVARFSSVFLDLQETDNWKVTVMEVDNHMFHGCDHGKTAIMCPRQVSQFRRSWVGHERCKAILVVSLMILSVHMPHGGCVVEDYTEKLEVVKIIMEEGREMVAKYFIGGDINIELKLEEVSEDTQVPTVLIGMAVIDLNVVEAARTWSFA